MTTLDPVIAEELRQGKLETTCPVCHLWEAASWYCSGCLRRSGPDDWYRNGDQAERDRRGARRDTRERRARNSATPHKRGPGRPRRTSEPEAVA
jgi:hypothetical protein